MGMFDLVDFEMDCPKCGNKLKEFQTKDGECLLDLVHPFHVNNFYSSCDKCKTRIEFIKENEEKENYPKVTIDDLLLNGYTMKSSTIEERFGK